MSSPLCNDERPPKRPRLEYGNVSTHLLKLIYDDNILQNPFVDVEAQVEYDEGDSVSEGLDDDFIDHNQLDGELIRRLVTIYNLPSTQLTS